MSVIEYRAIVAKVVFKNDEVHVTHAVEGGQTVRMIYRGLTPILGIVEAVKTDMLQIEDKSDE